MHHGVGRFARRLILLAVMAAHALVLLLPGPAFDRITYPDTLLVQIQTDSVVEGKMHSPQEVPTVPARQKTHAPLPPQRLRSHLPKPPAPARVPPTLGNSRPAPVTAAEPAPSSLTAASAVIPAAPATVPVPRNEEVAGAAKPLAPAMASNGAGNAGAAKKTVSVVRRLPHCDTRLRESDYPASARRDEQEGRVLVRVHVLSSGQVEVEGVAQSSGVVQLDEAALRAARRWQCAPASVDGVAVDMRVAVPVVFRLDD